jgi:hypothetical protein
MTDTAWVSLAVIFVAICITAVVVVTRYMREFRLQFPVPFLKEPFILSPRDSEGVHREHLMRCNVELFRLFVELTKQGDGIDRDAVRSQDPKVIERLVSLHLLHSRKGEIDPDSIELGYLGWQALQKYLQRDPKASPWSWPEDFPDKPA